MELLLDVEELLDITTGASPEPAKRESDEWHEWRKLDKRARLEIMLNVDEKQSEIIRKLTSAAAMWAKLKELYEPQDGTTKLHTLATLFNMCVLQEEEDVPTFLSTWEAAMDDATTAGNCISEDIKIGLVLSKLPESWGTFITMHSSTATLSELLTKIRHEDIRRQKKNNAQPIAMAVSINRFQRGHPANQQRYRPEKVRNNESNNNKTYIKSESQKYYGNNSRQNGSFRIICRYCKKEGHTDRVCRLKQAEKNSNRPQAHNVVIQQEDDRNPEYSFEEAPEQNGEPDEEEYIQAYNANTFEENEDDSTWFLDTGATHHLTYRKDWLDNYQELPIPLKVTFGDKGQKVAVGKGNIKLRLISNHVVQISDIYFVPGIAKHLLSVGQATAKGMTVKFSKQEATLYIQDDQHEIKIVCPKQGQLYPVKANLGEALAAEVHQGGVDNVSPTYLWHCRFGHLHTPTLKLCQNQNLVRGLPSTIFKSIDICEGCMYGKMAQKSFPLSNSKTKELLQLVHMDVCGPITPNSLSGARYFITFIDNTSRFTMVNFLKQKGNAFKAFCAYKSFVENQTQLKVKVIRSDNGGEFVSQEWEAFNEKNGIFHQKSTVYTPQQNGIAERKNRTLLNAARSMLKTSGMASRFWEEAVATACYLQNRTPHQGIEGQVPYTMWYGYPPEISHLRVFGATAFAYIQPAKRTKLEDRCIKGKFIGYGEPYGVKAYRIYLPDTGKIIFSRSVEFDEKSLFSRSSYVMKETESEHLTKEITKLRLPQATAMESENDGTNIINTELHNNCGAPITNATKNRGEKLNQLPHSQILTTQDEGLGISAVKTATKPMITKSATRSLEPEDVLMHRQQPNSSSSTSECRNCESEHTSSGHLQPYTSEYPQNLKIGSQFFRQSDAQSPEGEQVHDRSLESNNQSTAQYITRSREPEHTSGDHIQPCASSMTTRKQSSRSENMDLDRLKTCNLSKTTLKDKEIRAKKTKVRLLSDIYDATKDEVLEKSTCHFATETESDISIFAAIIEGDNYDTAPILTFKQALKSKEKDNWVAAIKSEFSALQKNHTWTLVPRPCHANVITCKWLFTKKYDALGTPVRFKARLVARGFSQIPGVDYHETFSPTLKITALRLILAITAYLNLELHHVDVETTFLHGDLEEDIYMEQPQMLDNNIDPNYVCKLNKPLYGLKQSPRQWYAKFHRFLLSIKFQQLQSEPNIYIRKTKTEFLLLGVYVDDLPIAGTSEDLVMEFIAELRQQFPIKHLGPLEHFLGIHVKRNRTLGTLSLSQENFVDNILTKFDMFECSPISTPLTVPCKLSSEDSPHTTEETYFMKNIPYRQVLGSIRYLVSCTRPDLSFATGYLSRFMENPGVNHWKALKRVLRYLKYTRDMTLTYTSYSKAQHSNIQGWLSTPLHGWTDADWGGTRIPLDPPLAMYSYLQVVPFHGEQRNKLRSPSLPLKQNI